MEGVEEKGQIKEEKLGIRQNIKPNATYRQIRKTGDKPLEWELNRGPKYWEYRKKWDEIPKLQITTEGPLHLDIETTNLCNLTCFMCPRTVLVNEGKIAKDGEIPLGSMDFDFYCSLIDQGAELGACSVKLNYLGEPLIHRDVFKQVAYAKEKGYVDVMFNTNGALLTEEKSKQLLDAGLDSIFFSFDSPYPEKYNKIRTGTEFHKVKRNVEKFMEIKEKGGYKHVQTRISLVLMDQGEQELEDYKKMFLDLIGVVGFGEFSDREKDYGKAYGIVPDFACAQPFQRMFIAWDGFVFPCCVDDKRELPMGDARKNTIREIWHGPRYTALRNAMKTGTYYKFKRCST